MKVLRRTPSEVVARGGEDLKRWRARMAVDVPGAEYTSAYRKGHWDGKKRPGRLSYRGPDHYVFKCGRGLLPTIREQWPDLEERQDFSSPEVSLNWHPPEFEPRWDMLRDYQREALCRIFRQRWGRIGLATNAGKGAIIAMAARAAGEAGVPVLILSDEISVFQALEEEIQKWGDIDPAKVEAGRDDPPVRADVTLAMVPTLHRRLEHEEWREWLGEIGMVLLDEADRAAADRWQEVLKCLPNTHYRFGFSGSFDTTEPPRELVLLESMGPVVQWVKNEDLIERGISARPVVELIRYQQDFPRLPPAKEWFDLTGPERRRWAFEQGVVYNQHRHELVQRLIDPNHPNAVVVNRIAHGEELAEVLPDSVFLHGSHSRDQRDQVLSRFREGGFHTLITTKILDRGTNLLGEVVGLIFASGEGSDTQTLQRVGRGLRKGEDDKEFLFLRDIIDTPAPAADSHAVNPYKYFTNAVKKRVDLYNEESFEVQLKKGSDL